MCASFPALAGGSLPEDTAALWGNPRRPQMAPDSSPLPQAVGAGAGAGPGGGWRWNDGWRGAWGWGECVQDEKGGVGDGYGVRSGISIDDGGPVGTEDGVEDIGTGMGMWFGRGFVGRWG